MSRYQRLPTLPEDEELETVQLQVMHLPAETPQEGRGEVATLPPPPPAYVVEPVTKLPSYEEVQQQKGVFVAVVAPSAAPTNRSMEFQEVNGTPLGNDTAFVLCFLVALCFNWLGYLMVVCLATSVAAQTGALSGFGVALMHIAFFALHHHGQLEDEAHPTDDATAPHHHLHKGAAIAIAVLGGLFMLRGVSAYVQAKRIVRAGLN
eukprot:m.477686 g.477686  ORF g.477686 m.477686 type:complete len:206 (+) comp20920_c0_seq1:2225-2842(+)